MKLTCCSMDNSPGLVIGGLSPLDAECFDNEKGEEHESFYPC